MTRPDIDGIAERARAAGGRRWEWWTSNSWRRLSTADTSRDGDVLCPIVARSDGHPDLAVSEEAMGHIAGLSPAAALEVVAYVAHIEERLEAAVAALRQVERVHGEDLSSHLSCPWCTYPSEDGHTFDCALAAAIGAERGGTKERQAEADAEARKRRRAALETP